MNEPRLERRRKGIALVTDARLSPFGYLRGGKLRMKSGADSIEFTPEDLERLAGEIRAEHGGAVFRLSQHNSDVLVSRA